MPPLLQSEVRPSDSLNRGRAPLRAPRLPGRSFAARPGRQNVRCVSCHRDFPRALGAAPGPCIASKASPNPEEEVVVAALEVPGLRGARHPRPVLRPPSAAIEDKGWSSPCCPTTRAESVASIGLRNGRPDPRADTSKSTLRPFPPCGHAAARLLRPRRRHRGPRPLGKVLVYRPADGPRPPRGGSTETEAYIGAPHDEASPFLAGRTHGTQRRPCGGRRAVPTSTSSTAMHHCLQSSSLDRRATGRAVLLARRRAAGWLGRRPAAGQAGWARAFGLTRLHDKADLVRGPLCVSTKLLRRTASRKDGPASGSATRASGERRPLRFVDADSLHVSRPSRSRAAAATPTFAATTERADDGDPRCQGHGRERASQRTPPHARSCSPRPKRRGGRVRGLVPWLARHRENAWSVRGTMARTSTPPGRFLGEVAEVGPPAPTIIQDLHLTDYKEVRIELSSHDAGRPHRPRSSASRRRSTTCPAAWSKAGPRPRQPGQGFGPSATAWPAVSGLQGETAIGDTEARDASARPIVSALAAAGRKCRHPSPGNRKPKLRRLPNRSRNRGGRAVDGARATLAEGRRTRGRCSPTPNGVAGRTHHSPREQCLQFSREVRRSPDLRPGRPRGRHPPSNAWAGPSP